MASMARCTARFLVNAKENSTPPRRQARTTARVPKAASPRTRIFPLAPAARAVAMTWAIMPGALGRAGLARPQPHPGNHRRGRRGAERGGGRRWAGPARSTPQEEELADHVRNDGYRYGQGVPRC